MSYQYSKEDMNLLSYLVDKNILSLQQAIDWAYSQFHDINVPEWLEKLSLAISINEFKDILIDEFSVYGELDVKDHIGEVVFLYKTGQLRLDLAVMELLYYSDISDMNIVSREEKSLLYVIEHYSGLEKEPEKKTLNELMIFFDKYYLPYIERRNKFIVS